MVTRRILLTAGALAGTLAATKAVSLTSASLDTVASAAQPRLRPGLLDDQSYWLQQAINQAALDKQPLELPAGVFKVSNITIRNKRLLIRGVPGATRLLYGGGGHLISGEDLEEVRMEGVVLDGGNLPLGDYVSGLLHLSNCPDLTLDQVSFRNSTTGGAYLVRAGGRIANCHVRDVADTGLFSIEAQGLSIRDNDIARCGNGGVRVWRWADGEDGTILTGNRIADIGSDSGGTGQNGNGINIFRANSVIVANNHISDCFFSAIRGNSASNVQIMGNSCRGLGETAIYAEFGFEGAVISNNIIDGATTGISITNLDSGGRLGVCSGNLIRNLNPHTKSPAGDLSFLGTGIAVEADTAISGNVIENAPAIGMLLGWGPYMRNITATGNLVRKAGIGIGASVVDGVGSAVITDNVIADAQKGAILGMQWTKIVSDDLARTDRQPYANLTVKRNRVVTS
ncbi:TIGR03808 family TAT-translocated repetitive protein [Coralliovum pocilloporae]|uniref:TIGR03808 family TAT-translocated repetitive protein n=1 Tax=Coralliovum pocilloporae TaxID=3066369 RepID=UPI003306FB48